jgi:hypothetical protein
MSHAADAASPPGLESEPTRDRLPSIRPVGLALPRPRPERRVLEGRWARLEPLDSDRHGPSLYALGHEGEAALGRGTTCPTAPSPPRRSTPPGCGRTPLATTRSSSPSSSRRAGGPSGSPR